MNKPKDRFTLVGLLVAIILFTGLIYSVGLDGPMVFDDVPNITGNYAVKIEALDFESLENAAFSIKAGPLYRPVSMVTFALNYYWGGDNTYIFKSVNLIIHLLAGLAVAWVVYLLLILVDDSSARFRSVARYSAVFVASLWLVHPLNLSSVLYVVQRMNSLSALFEFLALGFYLLGRFYLIRCENATSKAMLCWLIAGSVFFPLAVFSKENALLLPWLILVIEEVLLKWRSGDQAGKSTLLILRVALWLSVVLVVLALFLNLEWLLGSYANRDFTLLQRLLTEPRILFLYLKMILVPNIQSMTFYHDDVPLYSSLRDSGAMLCILSWLALLGLAAVMRKKFGWFLFALCWFLVGHSMESSVIALELAHEHRNYVPMLGVLLLPGTILYRFLKRGDHPFIWKLLGAALVLVLGLSTAVRAQAWGSMESLVWRQQRLNPDSVRANYALGQYLFAKMLISDNEKSKVELYEKIVPIFEKVGTLDVTEFSGYFGLIRLNDQMGYTVPDAWVSEAGRRVETVPLGQPDLAHIQDLLHCQLNQYCNLDGGAIRILVESALSNKTLPADYRITMSADYGMYLLINDQYQRATHYLMEVLSMKPGWWEYRIAAAESLMKSGNAIEAVRLLEDSSLPPAPEVYSEVIYKIKERARVQE